MIYIFSRRTSNCIDRLKNISLKNKKSLFLYISARLITLDLSSTLLSEIRVNVKMRHNTNALHIYLNLTKSENQF